MIIGLLTAMALIGLYAATVNADDDSNGSSDYSTDTTEPEIQYTRYGCEIRPIEGYDGATQVEPPYCTDAHVIEEYCGWSLDDVLVPPQTPAPSRRDYQNDSSYSRAIFSFNLPTATGEPAYGTEGVSLVCAGIGGQTNHFWTLDEWKTLNDPV